MAVLACFAVAACGGGSSSSAQNGPGDAGSGTDASRASDAGSGSDASQHSDAGGAGDGGHASDAGLGQPITAPQETWTWIPFDDAFCADGSTTGIGVNLTTKSQRVLIYLEGGGACWSESTCYTLMTASYFTTGYGPADFMTESTDATYLAMSGGFFDRSAAANPFKDYSYVYVPYCTGDLHAGNAPAAMYGTHTAKHVGYTDMAAFLRRIVPTFQATDRVILAGSSAGGFGAEYNLDQTQRAFGGVRVDLLDDSGIFLATSANTNDAAVRAAWNLAATLPAGCAGCKTALDALVPYYRATYPNSRFAMLSYTQDSTIPSYDGITTAQFTQALDAETSTNFDPDPAVKYFYVGASGHVLLFSPTLASNSVTLQQWLTQFATDDAGWTSEHP